MKALEKAAKDRQEPAAGGPPAGALPAVDLDLQLQPLEPRAAPAAGPAAAPHEPSRDQARAAAVMRASETPSGGALSALLARPVLLAGSLAGAFAVAYGTYVYLQLFHPSVFAPGPGPVALKPAPVPPPAPAPSASRPPHPSRCCRPPPRSQRTPRASAPARRASRSRATHRPSRSRPRRRARPSVSPAAPRDRR